MIRSLDSGKGEKDLVFIVSLPWACLALNKILLYVLLFKPLNNPCRNLELSWAKNRPNMTSAPVSIGE